MSVKNTGKKYEEIVRDIYQAIVEYDNPESGYKKIEVQHDVVLKGMSGTTHQIDVYWEFELAGLTYKTIVEVKDWKSKVQQEKIHSFNSVKQDIAGCSNAVFVSKSGFQKGAIKYARHYGMTLCQIEPNTEKSLKIVIEHITTHYIKGQLYIDDIWVEQDLFRKEFLKSYIHNRTYAETYLIHPLGQKMNLYEMFCEDAVPYYQSRDAKGHKIEKDLDGPWFFETGNDELPLVKITGYEFVCYNTFDYYTQTVNNICEYIVKDVLDENKVLYYHKEYDENQGEIGKMTDKIPIAIEVCYHQKVSDDSN